MARRSPPVEVRARDGVTTTRFADGVVMPDDTVIERLRSICDRVDTDPAALYGASRDWWPLTLCWATDGEIPASAAVVVTPSEVTEVAGVVELCNDERIPITTAAGRSGVCGGAIPLHGGVVVDMSAMAGLREVDATSLIIDVAAGTYGGELEATLRSDHGLTLGHWPQSMDISTVGGWLACRSAGQLSTRYGKIEDMVIGIEAVLADGTVIDTGGQPRRSTGPDLNQVLIGSEGTLGIITSARLSVHPAPTHERRAAFGFATFAEGLDACRRIMRRGVRPAVLRLYDSTEGNGNFSTGAAHPLIVLDEGDPVVIDATMAVVAEECANAAPLSEEPVARWLAHRNDVDALGTLIDQGLVVDTIEVTGNWGALEEIHRAVTDSIAGVEGTLLVTAHQSHAYVSGACIYLTFVAQPQDAPGARDRYYREAWDAAMAATLAAGGAISHHHGIGMNRAPYMGEALGAAFDTLVAIKAAIDPNGIMNPGKLGLPDPFATAQASGR